MALKEYNWNFTLCEVHQSERDKLSGQTAESAVRLKVH